MKQVGFYIYRFQPKDKAYDGRTLTRKAIGVYAVHTTHGNQRELYSINIDKERFTKQQADDWIQLNGYDPLPSDVDNGII